MTYGVLAMTCKTKESAEKLLSDMAEKQLKYVFLVRILIGIKNQLLLIPFLSYDCNV